MGIVTVTAMSLMMSITAFAGTWQQDAIGWWWLNDDGTYPANGWIEDQGKWYYFDGNGYMVSNVTLTIDEIEYSFDSSGAMIVGNGNEDSMAENLSGRYKNDTTGAVLDITETESGYYVSATMTSGWNLAWVDGNLLMLDDACGIVSNEDATLMLEWTNADHVTVTEDGIVGGMGTTLAGEYTYYGAVE